jgi:hypothetical protein
MLSFVFWAILSLLLVLTANALGCVGFGMQASPLSQCTSRRRFAQKKGSHSHLSSHRAMTLKLAKALSDDDTSATIVTKSAESYFVDAEFFELQISPHRPLGCTVEESLGEGRHVFVSKVVPDGNAAKAGIAVGDVLIGVTAVTGDQKMDVSGLGIETIKGLVASRPENESLSLKLARGTTVVEDHEQAIVDLCGNEDQSESEAEQCVLDFLKSGYDYANDSDDSMEAVDDVDAADSAAEEEDLVGNMYSMWNEDMPAASPKPEPIPASEAASVVKPWSSRSSPSGTFIRDPTTGKMKNIDA